MNWQSDIPIGMVQYDELVERLSTLAGIATRQPEPDVSYLSALYDVAQMHGLGPHLAARLEAQPAVHVEAPSMLRLGD